MKTKTRLFPILLLLGGWLSAFALEHPAAASAVHRDLPYKSGELSACEKTACVLDIHVPKTAGSPFPVLVHFYGGGLTSGDKGEAWNDWAGRFGEKFLEAGVLVVSPGYRLGGKGARYPDYLRDAAAAVAWVQRNIARYGGDPERVFVGGFSAGAYLAMMIALDPTWYAELDFDPRKIAGYLPISGQTYTHSQVATERGIAKTEITDAAPLGHVHGLEVPMQLFAGGKEGATITHNRTLAERLRAAGGREVIFTLMPDRDHQAMVAFMGRDSDETRAKFLEFIHRHRARVR